MGSGKWVGHDPSGAGWPGVWLVAGYPPRTAGTKQLHVVGAVVTTSASPGHRESICTSSVRCGRAAESVSAAAGSLAAVAAYLLLCPLSPLFQAARPSWASRRLRDPVFLFRVVSYI